MLPCNLVSIASSCLSASLNHPKALLLTATTWSGTRISRVKGSQSPEGSSTHCNPIGDDLLRLHWEVSITRRLFYSLQPSASASAITTLQASQSPEGSSTHCNNVTLIRWIAVDSSQSPEGSSTHCNIAVRSTRPLPRRVSITRRLFYSLQQPHKK